MKTLANEADWNELRDRLASLTGAEQRQWGSMTVGEMVCHVRTAYHAIAAGQQLTVIQKPSPMPPRVMKYLALRGPKWPPNVPTTREMEVGQPGVIPGVFADDRESAIAAMDLFRSDPGSVSHPFLGPMSSEDWLRWGYLHADHHLRQFGK